MDLLRQITESSAGQEGNIFRTYLPWPLIRYPCVWTEADGALNFKLSLAELNESSDDEEENILFLATERLFSFKWFY